MSIKARLQGDLMDLEVLAGLFQPPNEPTVTRDDEGFYLTSTTMLDGMSTAAPEAMRAAAALHLQRANGAARVEVAGFQPVELTNTYWDPAEPTWAVAIVDTLGLRDSVSVSPAQRSNPSAPRWVQLADQDREVQDVLGLLAKPEPAPDWFDLYKVFEIVGYSILHRHGSPPEKKIDLRGVIAGALPVSATALRTFTSSANHQGASGAAARHARLQGPPPGKIISIQEARQLVRQMVQDWLDWLGKRP